MSVLDTLKATRKLRDNGLDESAAEAIVEVVDEATDEATSDLATKTDLKADIAQLRADTKADLAELKADLFRAMWFFGTGIITVILVGMGVLLTILD